MLDILGGLTTCITRLNEYIKILPDKPALYVCIRQVCDEYIGFCISAILFCEKSRWRKYLPTYLPMENF